MHPDLAAKLSCTPSRQVVVASHGSSNLALNCGIQASGRATRALAAAVPASSQGVALGGATVAVPSLGGSGSPLFDDYCPTPRLWRMLRSWAGLAGMGLLIAAGSAVAVCAVAGALFYLAGAVLAVGNALIALGTGLIMVAIGVPLCLAMLSAQNSTAPAPSTRRYRRP
jgi:hypothetical protein